MKRSSAPDKPNDTLLERTGTHELANLDRSAVRAIRNAIHATLPKSAGQRNKKIFELCRYLKAIPSAKDLPPSSLRLHVPARCRELLLDLKAYNEMTDQTPYVVLDRRQYQTMTAKWEYRRKNGMAWENRDMQNNTLSKFKRHLRWANITPEGSLSLHTLRKTCITNWANEIKNPEVVRVLAGHSDIKTTMQFYSKATEEQRRKAASAIDRLLEAGLASGNRYV